MFPLAQAKAEKYSRLLELPCPSIAIHWSEIKTTPSEMDCDRKPKSLMSIKIWVLNLNSNFGKKLCCIVLQFCTVDFKLKRIVPQFFLDAIASPSTYPCDSQCVSDSFRFGDCYCISELCELVF